MSFAGKKLLMLACCASLAAGAAEVVKTPVELENPSFEKGVGGYWLNIPEAAAIDDENSTQGARSLKLDLKGGKPVDTVFYVPARCGELWTLEFDAKAEGNPNIQIKVMLHSEKPICFWTQEKGAKYVEEFQPSEKWGHFKCVFGPLPKEAMGKEVAKAGIFISSSGEPSAKLWIDNISIFSESGKDISAVIGEAKPKTQSKQNPPAPVGGADLNTAPEKQKSAEQRKNGNSELLKIVLPSPLQIYEGPAKLVVFFAPQRKDDAQIHLKLFDFRDNLRLDKSAPVYRNVETLVEMPGYYRAEATLEKDGEELERSVTSFMVTTPLPQDFYSTPEPSFGVWGLENEPLRQGGAKWTRQLFFTLFQKPDFKGEPPSSDELAAKSPIKVIKCLNILNPFKKMVPVTQEEWPQILEKTGKEIVSQRGLVDIWETQNEPMVGENFHGKMEDVVDIIANESRLVRKIDPGTPIAGVCVNPMSANQYGQIIGYYQNHKMDKLVDAVMIHPYIPNAAAPDSSGYPEMLAKLTRDLKEITGHDVPIYISEIGYSTKPGGEVSELEQAAYIARVALINRGYPNLKACVWHIGLWNEATSQRELDYGILRQHPKNSPLREPKPAFAAWATMSRQTYNADYLGELEFGRGAKVMLFSRKGLPLLVAYSLSKTPKTLKIPLSGGKALVTDLCGSSAESVTENGILTVNIDEAPVYIAGNGQEDISRLKDMKIEFDPQDLRTKPGKEAILLLKGAPLATEGVSLKVETPAGWSNNVEGKGEAWKVKLNVPETAEPGEQSVFIHLVKNGESRRVWNREIVVQAPIEITEANCVSGNGLTARLEFTPRSDRKDEHFKLKVFEGAKQIADGDFQVNKDASLEIPQPSFGRPHQYRAEIDDGIHKPWKTPLPSLNRFPISQGFSKFAIENGEPSKGSIDGAFDRPQGTISLGWSEKALLIKVDTKDKWHVVAKTPESMWSADSLQIGIAVAQSEMIHQNNDGIQETLFTSFGLMPADGGICKSWVWASSNRNLAELSSPLPDIEATWTREGETTKYVAAIPWKSLNVKTPRIGLPLKFSMLINDADESKQRHWVEWYGGIASGMDLSLYGDAILAK